MKKLHFRDPCVVKQNRKCAINFRYKEFVGDKILFYYRPSMSKHIKDQQSIKIFKVTEHEAQFPKYSRENE